MKLIIDRERWLRGEGGMMSFLLRPRDGKMCCLGLYLEQCGMSHEDLFGLSEPFEVTQQVPLPDAGQWLVDPDNTIVDELMRLNDDDESMTEPQREAAIAKQFAIMDIEVEFR